MKYGITIGNAPGTVDPDYRGEVGVLLINHGQDPFSVEKNMRIAQLVFYKSEIPNLEETEKLPETIRGVGGFGSTGLFGPGLGTKEYNEEIRKMDRYYMKVVLAIAERSNCVRGCKKLPNGRYQKDAEGKLIGQIRKFGCIIVKDDNIISQGFNEQFPKFPKCEDDGCLRDELKIPSGTQIEKCRAMHAEWWAITNLARSGAGAKGATAYINTAPCEVCARLLAGAGIDTLVILEDVYPPAGLKILSEAGITIRAYPKNQI